MHSTEKHVQNVPIANPGQEVVKRLPGCRTEVFGCDLRWSSLRSSLDVLHTDVEITNCLLIHGSSEADKRLQYLPLVASNLSRVASFDAEDVVDTGADVPLDSCDKSLKIPVYRQPVP